MPSSLEALLCVRDPFQPLPSLGHLRRGPCLGQDWSSADPRAAGRGALGPSALGKERLEVTDLAPSSLYIITMDLLQPSGHQGEDK